MDFFDELIDARNNPQAPAGAAVPASFSPGQLLEGLNPQQAEAVRHDRGPLLILAGAGSGKTRVITHRIAWLVRVLGVRPSQILAITFTNKAAAEMKGRIEQLIGDKVMTMWVGTFHAMMIRVLRRFADRLGFDRNFTIIDTDDQLKVIKACLTELRLDEKAFVPKAVHGQISSWKNALSEPSVQVRLAGNEYRMSKIAQVYALYQDKLKKSNSMDFDDILVFAVRLLENHADIRTEYQDRFQYVLVDEYQDTNHAQYRLIRMLSASHHNLCVVGDDDQSIYSFRGANIQNILDFEKDFPDCKVIKLEQNYRSTKTILDAANTVIQHNKGRKMKTLWTSSGSGDKITFYRADNHSEEGGYVASEIARICRSGRGASYRDIAILYRLNALSRTLEAALRDRGIPYRIFGGMRFYDRREIKDVLAYLRLIAIPADDLSFDRVINLPRRGIGDVTLDLIDRAAVEGGVSKLAVCRQALGIPALSRVAGKLKAFADLIDGFRDRLLHGDDTLASFIDHVQSESGLIEELINEQDKSRLESVDRLENLKELLSDALEFSNNLAALRSGSVDEIAPEDQDLLAERLPDQLNAFLERAALYSEMDEDRNDNDYVRLMTIHSAKGLEFRTVFLVGAEEGLFPGYRALASDQDLEEERRLAYVAITRARERLFITTARNRLIFGQTQTMPVSRFICDIPAEYIDEFGGCRTEGRGGFADGGMRSAGAAPSAGPTTASGPAPFGAYRPTDGKRPSGATTPATSAFTGIDSFTRKPASGTGRIGSAPGTAAIAGATASTAGMKAQAPAQSAAAAKGIDPTLVRKGDKVRHARFGVGKVVMVDLVAGDAILTVQFDAAGLKRMMARQAPLELL